MLKYLFGKNMNPLFMFLCEKQSNLRTPPCRLEGKISLALYKQKFCDDGKANFIFLFPFFSSCLLGDVNNMISKNCSELIN